MTKRRASRHRVPTHLPPPADVEISDRYQVEIDMSTQRLERQYRKAERALEAAQKRADKAWADAVKNVRDRKAQHRHRDLQALVEERRRELRQIELLMMPEGYGRDSRRRKVRHETGSGDMSFAGYTADERNP